MDLLGILFLIVFIVILVVGFRYYLLRKSGKINIHDAEIRALNHVLAGEKESALKILLEIARTDTDNIGAYLQVGDLYRQLGQAEAAVRVHQDILERDGISQDVIMMVHERLAQDYETQKNYTQALYHAEAMLKIDRKHPGALQAVHRYYKNMKKWEKAIKAYQREVSVTGKTNPNLPALYKTQRAIESLADGDKAGAVTLLKQAIKMGGKCAAPYYQLGKIRQEEGNYKHAIDFLTTFVELDPTAGSLVFSDIEKMYFELGQFDQVEQLYKRLHQKQPDNLDVILGLAGYFERKGEHRDASSLLEEASETDSINLSVILGRLRLLDKLGAKDALNRAIDEVIRRDQEQRILKCDHCGTIASEPSYICAKCGWIKEITA